MTRSTAAFLAMTFGIILPTSAGATMPRPPGATIYGPQGVWTDGTTTAIFHPVSPVLPAASYQKIRVGFEMQLDTGECDVRPAIRFSNDQGVNWDADQAVDATNLGWMTSPGVDFGEDFIAIDTIPSVNPKAWFQLGFQVKTNSASGVFEQCMVWMRVEVDKG